MPAPLTGQVPDLYQCAKSLIEQIDAMRRDWPPEAIGADPEGYERACVHRDGALMTLREAVRQWPQRQDRRLRFIGKDGWPVERIRGRPIVNVLRLLLHTRRITRSWSAPRPRDVTTITPTPKET